MKWLRAFFNPLFNQRGQVGEESDGTVDVTVPGDVTDPLVEGLTVEDMTVEGDKEPEETVDQKIAKALSSAQD